MDLNDYYIPASPAHIKKERAKARELRSSRWWSQVKAEGICYYCEGEFASDELTMDHKVPVARGGMSNKGNIVASCKDCNTKKRAKTSAELVFES